MDNYLYVSKTDANGHTFVVKFFTSPEGEVTDVSVEMSTTYGWCWTRVVGSYDDWTIRRRVEEIAKEEGISIPEYLWYVEPEYEVFWLVTDHGRVINETEYVPHDGERVMEKARELDTALELVKKYTR